LKSSSRQTGYDLSYYHSTHSSEQQLVDSACIRIDVDLNNLKNPVLSVLESGFLGKVPFFYSHLNESMVMMKTNKKSRLTLDQLLFTFNSNRRGNRFFCETSACIPVYFFFF